MEAKIKIKKWVNGEPWSHGMVTLGKGKVFTFHMKHFERPSQFGIDDGRGLRPGLGRETRDERPQGGLRRIAEEV